MPIQLTDKLRLPNSYVDDVMSVETFSELLSMDVSSRFTGLTVTVQNFIGKKPADFWLVGGFTKKYWRLKNLPTVDSLDDLDVLDFQYVDPGFEVYLSDGTIYQLLKPVGGDPRWEKSVTEKDMEDAMMDANEALYWQIGLEGIED